MSTRHFWPEVSAPPLVAVRASVGRGARAAAGGVLAGAERCSFAAPWILRLVASDASGGRADRAAFAVSSAAMAGGATAGADSTTAGGAALWTRASDRAPSPRRARSPIHDAAPKIIKAPKAAI